MYLQEEFTHKILSSLNSDYIMIRTATLWETGKPRLDHRDSCEGISLIQIQLAHVIESHIWKVLMYAFPVQ